MRLWSLHPRYLDPKGLVAGWREALLAQKVLQGRTTGYRNHPQLARFRACPDPLAGIAMFLRELHADSARRGYRFDAAKIDAEALARAQALDPILVSAGQIDYEAGFLAEKLAVRDPERVPALRTDREAGRISPHPLFTIVPGPIADWEKAR
ncbi:pyrimidine dimer DNA glycosylase/endonuclease V [Rothia kristinae]|uniref:pyrimidine dimer DNA glycosylase/endonuclease V n=1 Tax=Rothia kristinae TaxID=37923 RepID=UPI001CD77F4C|nr:pyrimidine dimer DNA glycosylase/endonuclease V [Rothia kristinae]MCA1169235.1 pyrimidine dimer DNA glycosylase/endonuclease V [Rothia kristinae]